MNLAERKLLILVAKAVLEMLLWGTDCARARFYGDLNAAVEDIEDPDKNF